VIITLFDARVDTAHLNPGRNRRTVGILAIEIDAARKLGELSVGCAKKLTHPESDRGACLIELIGFVRGGTLN
jgi:hypothetical protein